MKQKYKVTLPIDLGDGEVHLAGEVVELEDGQAKDYAHALQRVEEKN